MNKTDAEILQTHFFKWQDRQTFFLTKRRHMLANIISRNLERIIQNVIEIKNTRNKKYKLIFAVV
jgi:hypothetical protein